MSAPLQKGTEVIAGETPHFSRRFLAAISSVPLRIASLQTSCTANQAVGHRQDACATTQNASRWVFGDTVFVLRRAAAFPRSISPGRGFLAAEQASRLGGPFARRRGNGRLRRRPPPACQASSARAPQRVALPAGPTRPHPRRCGAKRRCWSPSARRLGSSAEIFRPQVDPLAPADDRRRRVLHLPHYRGEVLASVGEIRPQFNGLFVVRHCREELSLGFQ